MDASPTSSVITDCNGCIDTQVLRISPTRKGDSLQSLREEAPQNSISEASSTSEDDDTSDSSDCRDGNSTVEGETRTEAGEDMGRQSTALCEQEDTVWNLLLKTVGPPGIVWTDDKHCSYLNFMEATFVRDLYRNDFCAEDVCGRSPERTASSWLQKCNPRSTRAEPPTSLIPEQFRIEKKWTRVQSNGRCERIEDPSGPVSAVSRWIKHFRSKGGLQRHRNYSKHRDWQSKRKLSINKGKLKRQHKLKAAKLESACEQSSRRGNISSMFVKRRTEMDEVIVPFRGGEEREDRGHDSCGSSRSCKA